MRFQLIRFFVLAALVLAAACGDGGKGASNGKGGSKGGSAGSGGGGGAGGSGGEERRAASLEWEKEPGTFDALEATFQLNVVVRDQRGAVMPSQPLFWSSSHPEVLEVSSAGLLTARSNGKATIEAFLEGAGGEEPLLARLEGTVAQRPEAVEFDPRSLDFSAVGDFAELSAVVADRNGFAISGWDLDWESEDEAIASVDASGRVEARGEGQTRVVARVSGSDAFGRVRVTVDPLPMTITFLQVPESFTAKDPHEVTVAVVDRLGNLVSHRPQTIQLSLQPSPNQATLSGTLSIETVGGIATFPDLSIDRAGEGNWLLAEAPGLEPGESPRFSVLAKPATALAFRTAYSAFPTGPLPTVEVEVQDEDGDRVMEGTHTITLSLGENPGGATLSGVLEAVSIDGVASFDEARLEGLGEGYTLLAHADGLQAGESPPFKLLATLPGLTFLTQPPASIQAGAEFEMRVELRDALGQLIQDPTVVTLSLGGGGTLLGGDEASTENGIATFEGLSIQEVAEGLEIVASTAHWPDQLSNPFDVIAAAPASLVWHTEPQDALSGESLGSLRLGLVDAYGNPSVAEVDGTVSLQISTQAGSEDASFVGDPNPTAPIVSGVADFGATLGIDLAGVYRLSAVHSEGELLSATSAEFTVSPGPPERLEFLASPEVSVQTNRLFPAEVAVVDAAGNSSEVEVEVSLSLDCGASTSTLHSLMDGLTKDSVSGVATFSDLYIDGEASSCQLEAEASLLIHGTSPSFAVDPSIAAGLAVEHVVIYQAVGIDLVRGGVEVTSLNAPVIAGKDALLRVMVQPEAGWTPRGIKAEIELQDGYGNSTFHATQVFVTAASTEGDLATTFNFDIPGTQISEELYYTIKLSEGAPNPGFPGSTTGARWPAQGMGEIPTHDTNGPIELMLVPFRYFGGGFEGSTPDMSNAQIQRYLDGLGIFPVADASIQIYPMQNYFDTVDDGAGWISFLEQVCFLRNSVSAPANQFWYGLIENGSGPGIAGIGYLVDVENPLFLCGAGRGTAGMDSAMTLLHELGHNMGRDHTSCPGYRDDTVLIPDPDGKIGAWGWDAVNQVLLDPSATYDIMSYCRPRWLSDFTYDAIFTRLASVNAKAMVAPDALGLVSWRLQAIVLEMDDTLRWGGVNEFPTLPDGTPMAIDLLDGVGIPIGHTSGTLVRTSAPRGRSTATRRNCLGRCTGTPSSSRPSRAWTT